VTRFASLTRRQAAVVLGASLALAGWLLGGAVGPRDGQPTLPPPPTASAPSQNDVAFYKAVVARVRAGEGYYDAVAPELRARNYPLRPVFAWRQPTYAWLLAALPGPRWATALLIGLGAAVVGLAAPALGAVGRRGLVVVALMSVTMAGAFVEDFVYLQEAWAGALVALSVCLSATGRWRGAVAAGLGALAFREFALWPCVVSLALAARARRFAEARAWAIGLVAYGGLLAWHISVVARHVLPTDVSRGWLALGGAPFVLEMCRWNSWLVLAPKVVVALALPLVLLGLVGARGGARAAAIVLGYLAMFSVVGHSFNDYWGALFAPLLTFGLVGAPAAVRELARVLARSEAAA
jgi:hypothetical protein